MTDDFDIYCQRYLDQWEERATVRRSPRTRLTADRIKEELFPASMSITTKHPEVQALGFDSVQRLMARSAADFMNVVTIAEVEIVAARCGRLANEGLGRVSLAESGRQVALTVATDESYHAYVAREFLIDLEKLLGVVPGKSPEHFMDDFVREQPADIARETDVLMLCFAENMLTEELMGFSKEADPKGIFHVVMREHMRDEGRHQIFFQSLLRYMWREIDEDTRVRLGRLIPKFLETSFSTSMNGFMERMMEPLTWIGFDAPTAERITKESLDREFGSGPPPPKHKMQFMKPAFNLLEQARVLEHAPTRQAMVEMGWADA